MTVNDTTAGDHMNTVQPSPDLLATFTRLGEDLLRTAGEAETTAEKAHADLQQLTADQHAEQGEVARLETRLAELRSSLDRRSEEITVVEGVRDSNRRAAEKFRADAAYMEQVVALGRQQTPGVLVAGGAGGDPAVTQAFDAVADRAGEDAVPAGEEEPGGGGAADGQFHPNGAGASRG